MNQRHHATEYDETAIARGLDGRCDSGDCLRMVSRVLALTLVCSCVYEPLTLDLKQTDPTVRRTWVAGEDFPRAIYGPRLAYHPGHQLIYAYGGESDAASLWAWDGAHWSVVEASCPPGPRIHHIFYYDSQRDRLVLFGGTEDAIPWYGPVPPEVLHDEVWDWDGAEWSIRQTTGDGPGPRHGSYAAYDPLRDRLVVFGGLGTEAAGVLGGLYELDGNQWSHITNNTQPAAYFSTGSSMTFVGDASDPTIRNSVVFAGGTGVGLRNHDEMWSWDGSSWRQICTGCIGLAHSISAVIYDPISGRVISANGFTGEEEIAGTWEYGDFGDGTIQWTQTQAIPPVRDSSGIAYDASRNEIVVVGGNGRSCNVDDAYNCRGTYVYRVTTTPSPTARSSR